jgi:putative CRISPR-associated protein (TIGR02619 family)
MSQTIINTVGTSLLGNAKRAGIDPSDDKAMIAMIATDPQKACAETNALSRLLVAGDRAEMLHSDTSEGELCARLVAKYIQQQGYEASLYPVRGLAYHAEGFVQYGLCNFVQLLTQRIVAAQASGFEVLINATGGFKAEIAYATAVGLVFKVPVCYIHEKFGDIVTLPVTPFGWDASIFALYQDFFDWIEVAPRAGGQVRSRVAALPNEVAMLLEEAVDGSTVLSPLGNAYLAAFRWQNQGNEQIPVLFSKKARRDWASFDHTTRQAYQCILNGLRLPNRYSRSELKSGGGDALGYPTGHLDERVFFSEIDNQLYVFEFTRHGRQYDELCSRGLRWSEYPRHEFQLVEP